MISVRDKISHVLITERAWVRGVGIDFLLQSCCCWCYVIQPVHHVLHECIVGCPILSSMHEHVLINQLELELTQTQMAQKPMLWAEVGMRVRCANKASA